MILFVKKCFRRLKPKSVEEKQAIKAMQEKARIILTSELSQQWTDGKPVSHRRLESLMLAADTDRKETIRLLREIGARPSSRRGGARLWTLG
ncbi:MAG: hypothetical protein V4726_19640 [Verrucomicrobiota bacterium]